MAQIDKPSLYFNTVLYTGTGSSLGVTGVGFQPDFTWIKCRAAGSATDHILTDAVRGVTKSLNSNDSSADDTISNALTAFGTDGFTVGANGATGASGDTYVSWNWKANGQGSSNSDGSINTTYTSVNTTAGFSISLYTGSGSAATIGHGLGAAPEIVIIKCTTHTENWVMYNKNLGAGKYIFPNTTAAAGPSSGTNTSYFNNTAPTNSVFSIGNDGGTNSSGRTYVAYCFKEKTGYSKFGSYTGNGNADGAFIYTGFKPAFVLCRDIENAAGWVMYDNKRANPFNQITVRLEANEQDLENTGGTPNFDILSNGFKFRTSFDNINRSGSEHIYMAFAENPIVGSNNIPTTAR